MIPGKINDLNHTLFRQGYQDGAALIFFISILLAMSLLTGYMLDLTTTSTFGELSYNHLDRAYFMAEAGGNYACKSVRLGTGTDIHNKTFTLYDDQGNQEGQFKIIIDDTDPRLVHSIGTITAAISSNVEVKLTYSIPSIFDHTIFAKDKITLKKDVIITGSIATNDSSISQVNYEGEVVVNAGKTLVPINFSCGTCEGDELVIDGDIWEEDEIYEFSNVTIEQNATLTIDGDVVLYVKENFLAGMGSTIKIQSDSSLTIYVDKKLEFDKDFAVEFEPPQPDDRAKDFVIYGTSNAESILMGKEITFIGTIYAPSADIDIQKAQISMGAIIGNTITIGKDTKMTYDESVLDIITPAGVGSISPPKQYFSS